MGWLWLRALAGRCWSIPRFRVPCTQRGVEHYSAVQLVCGFRACATPVSLPAAPLPLQAEAAAANEQAAAVRLGAEAAVEAIRAKAAAEVQAKAVSTEPRTQTPAQIAHHLHDSARFACLHCTACLPQLCLSVVTAAVPLLLPPPLLLLPPVQAVEASQLRQQLFEQQRAAREAESAVCAAAQDKEELSARVALLAATVDQLEG